MESEILKNCLKSFQINNNLLFHYTSINKGLENILYENKLKFNSFKNMNDPLESQDFFPSLITDKKPKEEDTINILTKGFNINKIIKNGFKISCFSIDKEFTKTSFNYYNKGYARSRMWSQYGENHRGLCFIFDKDKLIINIKKELKKKNIEEFIFYSREIIYTNDLKDLEEALEFNNIEKEKFKTENERLEEYSDAYIFTKIEDYKDEQEYRIAFYNEKFIEEDSICLNYGDSLIGIIIGYNFPDIYILTIKEYSKKKNFIPLKIFWLMDGPEIDLL